MNIKQNILEAIGNTPLIKINSINEGKAVILAKLESRNPAGSVKDRPALNMIEAAIQEGKINKDTVVIEPTSGNTGIALAMVCAVKGFKMILTMPETMSKERRSLMSAYGAEIILTDGKLGMAGAVQKAEELHKKIPNSFIPQQFANPANPEIHTKTTAKEIWEDTDGKVDIIIAGVGTGGTISGLAKYLKSKNPNIKAIAIEPKDSQLLGKGIAGPHKIQGIGANFVPKNFEKELIDEIFPVSNEDAFKYAKRLAREEGILSGISAGAAIFAAQEVAKRPENIGKTIVVILPDGGEKYLSTKIYED